MELKTALSLSQHSTDLVIIITATITAAKLATFTEYRRFRNRFAILNQTYASNTFNNINNRRFYIITLLNSSYTLCNSLNFFFLTL